VYSVQEGSLYYDDILLGSADAIYVDSRQHDMLKYVQRGLYPSEWPRFVVKQLSVGDYVFVTPEGMIVGIESKTAKDFFDSKVQQKLQRQSRDLVASVDIAMWGLLLLPGEEWTTPCLTDIVKWQAVGGSIQILPWDLHQTAQVLVELRTIMQPGTHLRSILRGDDWRRPDDVKDLSPCATALRRMFTGVGVKMAVLLDTKYEGDIIKALSAPEDEWREVKRMKELILIQKRKLCNPKS
jgi:ERCC4-type nuclease